jgi:phosphomethylpyrimidine synthase
MTGRCKMFQHEDGVSIYRGAQETVKVGPGLPVRVNLSVGVGRESTAADELRKIQQVLSHIRRPDLMMDLSIATVEPEPWQILVEAFRGPVGFLPHYLAPAPDGRLQVKHLLARIERAFRLGVAFITIHATPTRELFERARAVRSIPLTSRGGAVVLRDMIARRSDRSVFADVFDEVAQLASQYGVVIHLGTAFRAACIADGLDEVVLAEIAAQERWVRRASELGAMVTLEGPGHILLSDIPRYVHLTEHYKVPRMPLGPMVTDAHWHADHVVSAVGAAVFGACARGGIINAVTRVEHQGGVPSAPLLIEALDAAVVAAHAASITYDCGSRSADDAVAEARGRDETCVVDWCERDSRSRLSGNPACKRCAALCPLIRESYAAESAASGSEA